jgi:hypothetical protein
MHAWWQQGNRYGDHTITIASQEPIKRDGGFVADVTDHLWFNGTQRSWTLEFTPPGRIRWNFPGPAKLLMYVTPLDCGLSRVFLVFVGPAESRAMRLPMPHLPPMLSWCVVCVVHAAVIAPTAPRQMVNACSLARKYSSIFEQQ